MTARLEDLLDAPLPSGMADPYGFCRYRKPFDGASETHGIEAVAAAAGDAARLRQHPDAAWTGIAVVCHGWELVYCEAVPG